MHKTAEYTTTWLTWLHRQGIDMQHHSADCEAICRYLSACEPLRVIVELGVYQGGSMYMLAQFLRADGMLIGVDPAELWQQSYDTTRGAAAATVACELTRGGKAVHLVKKFSTDAVQDVHKLLRRNKIDLLHIDANHELIARDFKLYTPFVRRGGLVLLHDVCNGQTPVPAYWRKLMATYGSSAVPLWFAGARKYQSGIIIV